MTPHELPASHIHEGKTADYDYTLEITCPICNHQLVYVAFPNAAFDFENEEPIETSSPCPHTLYLFDDMPWSWIMVAPERKELLIRELIRLKPAFETQLLKKLEAPIDYAKVDLDDFMQYRPRNARTLAKGASETYPERKTWFADIHRPAGSVGCCTVDIHYSIVIQE